MVEVKELDRSIIAQDSTSQSVHRIAVIGTGLSGLAISNYLSRNKIGHLLIGPAPSKSHKLGESLDVTATLELLEQFPELSDCYYPKRWLDTWFGNEQRMRIDFGLNRPLGSAAFFRLAGTPISQLWHLDRSRFDCALFDRAANSKFCQYLDAKISSVSYERTTDSVTAIKIHGYGELSTAFVFDATSPTGPVASHVGIKANRLGAAQRVTYAHYQLTEDREIEDPWTLGTTVARLLPEGDGLDGIAWCIPMGETVSIGFNTDENGSAAKTEDVLTRLGCALSRRAINYQVHFGRLLDANCFVYQNYHHPRVFGKNWLLAGNAACQVWFMSGSGVGTGLAAGRVAADFVRHPSKAGRAYQRYVDGIAASHGLLDHMRYASRSDFCANALQTYCSAIVNANVRRTSNYYYLRRRLSFGILANLLYRSGVARWGLRRLCHRIDKSLHGAPEASQPVAQCNDREPLAIAASQIPEDCSSTRGEAVSNECYAVQQVLRVPAGELSSCVFRTFVRGDVVFRFERLRLRSRKLWELLAQFLNETRQSRDLKMATVSFEQYGTWVTYNGEWLARDSSCLGEIHADFRVVDGRIAEVRTHRENYVPVFGARIRSWHGLGLLGLQAFIWLVGRLCRRGDEERNNSDGIQ